MNSLFTAACAGITGLTIGIAFTHKLNLTQPRSEYAATLQSESVGVNPEAVAPLSSSQPVLVEHSADPIIQQKIDELLTQQETLKMQQAEFNREINAIQFRLDSYSQDFRPLRAENNSEILTPFSQESDVSPLLPPRF